VSVVVGGAVVVGWVLYRHYWAHEVYERIFRWDWIGERLWAISLVIALTLCVPYAVVLLVWGRGVRRATAGAAAALATGLVFWGIDHVFQTGVWHTSRDGVTAVRIYLWSELLSVALLVPLAWGLARRSGRAWVTGVVVGPLVAAALRELQLRWHWWHDRVAPDGHHIEWQLQAVAYMAPFVLAVLACWVIEARRESSA
jgi:hypothetical protein